MLPDEVLVRIDGDVDLLSSRLVFGSYVDYLFFILLGLVAVAIAACLIDVCFLQQRAARRLYESIFALEIQSKQAKKIVKGAVIFIIHAAIFILPTIF